jgi:acyl-CoA synthetase (AMP-forming)/AMP-acid ligase II
VSSLGVEGSGGKLGSLAQPRLDDAGQRHGFYRSNGLWAEERLGWLLANGAQLWPDREFVQIGTERFTYAEFSGWACALGRQLVDGGVRRGDRVLIQMPNRIEALLAQVAAFRSGAVAAPIVPIYREHELRHIVADCRPTAVITATEFRGRFPAREIDSQLEATGLRPLVKITTGEPEPGWEPFPGRASRTDEAALPEPLPADECALILYTSGTTSNPKGVRLSPRSFLSNARTLRLTTRLSSETVFFACAPLSHLAGFNSGILWPATLGARVVIMPTWDAEEAAALIEREQCTFTTGAAVFLHDLVSVYRTGRYQKHRLSVFMSGGAPTAPQLIREAEELGVKAFRAYGMTETAGGVTYSDASADMYHRANFDAKVGFGSEMEAVDDNRNPLPPGVHGELRIRSPQLLLGYTDPIATAAQIDADGWFYTGDVGTVDEEGWLTISGRVKDIINRAGEKFSARDIEDAIASHPGVDQAAVVGLPDDRMGEIVGAFVTLREPGAWQGPAELIEYLNQRKFAKQKIPVEWYVLESLPQSASGKLRKQELLHYRQATVGKTPGGAGN